jgi:leucyl aminopeptidase (aminopeptidase T)
VTLTVRDGKIVDFESSDRDLVATLRGLFARVGDDRAYVLAECGIGLNTEARLTGSMLTDEGAYGNVHFGFGSNATVGGKNKVPFHLDFVCKNASLDIDDTPLIRNGVLL